MKRAKAPSSPPALSLVEDISSYRQPENYKSKTVTFNRVFGPLSPLYEETEQQSDEDCESVVTVSVTASDCSGELGYSAPESNLQDLEIYSDASSLVKDECLQFKTSKVSRESTFMTSLLPKEEESMAIKKYQNELNLSIQTERDLAVIEVMMFLCVNKFYCLHAFTVCADATHAGCL